MCDPSSASRCTSVWLCANKYSWLVKAVFHEDVFRDIPELFAIARDKCKLNVAGVKTDINVTYDEAS